MEDGQTCRKDVVSCSVSRGDAAVKSDRRVVRVQREANSNAVIGVEGQRTVQRRHDTRSVYYVPACPHLWWKSEIRGEE